MKCTVNEALELLAWIADQPRLRIETWNYPGRGELVSVWTIEDDEDTPAARAPTVLEALMAVKKLRG